jgi:hypothetical protein
MEENVKVCRARQTSGGKTEKLHTREINEKNSISMEILMDFEDGRER